MAAAGAAGTGAGVGTGAAARGGGLGRKLLEEVRASRTSLWSALGNMNLFFQHYNTGPFNIPAIDNLLKPHLADNLHNQSQRAKQAAYEAENNRHDEDGESYDAPQQERKIFPFRNKPAIIEISSDRTAVGKTHLLYYIAAVALLPRTWNGISLNGKDASVVFIDCDNRFDINRFSQVACHYVKTRLDIAIEHVQEDLENARSEATAPPEEAILTEAEAEELEAVASQPLELASEAEAIAAKAAPEQQPEPGDEDEKIELKEEDPLSTRILDLEEHLSRLQSISPQDITTLTEFILHHIHIYTPRTPTSLLSILTSLSEHLLHPKNPTYGPQKSTIVSQPRHLSTILLDGISAFYWTELAASQPRKQTAYSPSQTPPPKSPTPSPSTAGPGGINFQSRYEQITTHLLSLSRQFHCSIVITNIIIPNATTGFRQPAFPSHNTSNSHTMTPFYPSTAGKDGLPFPTHLPVVYTLSPKFLSARIVLSKDRISPFRAGLGVKKAWTDEKKLREEVARNMGVSAWVCGGGVRSGEGVKERAKGGWFWFKIGEEGVLEMK